MRYTTLSILVPAAFGAVHNIKVGSSGLTFVPSTVTASEGDTVIFELFPGHDVVEGDGFSNPCKASDNGFYSGQYSDTDNGKKKFVVNVTSSDPTYFFCSLSRHCQAGMVGGINIPNSGGETIQEYGQEAGKVQEADTPSQIRGGQLLDDSQISSMTSTASAGPTASGSSSGSASTQSTGTPTGSTTPSASASASGSPSAGTQSTAGAVHFAPGQVSAAAAMVLGVAGWFV